MRCLARVGLVACACAALLLQGCAALLEFSPKQLAEFDGAAREDKKIYVAVMGRVFDVSDSGYMYGPGGSYSVLAGKDATLALAKMDMSPSSFDPKQLREGLRSMTPEHVESVKGWVGMLSGKYEIVGRYIPEFSDDDKDEPAVDDNASDATAE
ncbi:cytochrome b5-like heme/steroid binding domain-containing protein, partial [Tribonema minus]